MMMDDYLWLEHLLWRESAQHRTRADFLLARIQTHFAYTHKQTLSPHIHTHTHPSVVFAI